MGGMPGIVPGQIALGKLLLRRRPQKDRGNFQEQFIICGELEARVLEGLTEIIQLGKIRVAGCA
jgi:hypothetical protein